MSWVNLLREIVGATLIVVAILVVWALTYDLIFDVLDWAVRDIFKI